MASKSNSQKTSGIVLLRLRGTRIPQRRALPVRIGSSGASDVIINASAIAPHAYTIEANGRGVRITSNTTEREVTPQVLRQLGIDVIAVLDELPKGTTLARRFTNEVLARESALMQGMPPAVRSVVLGSMPQKARLGVWGLALAGAMALLAGALAPEAVVDLSQTPQTLAWDAIQKKTVGSNPDNPDFQKGYEKGFTLAFQAPADAAKDGSLLTFAAAALNFGSEVTLELNGKTVYVNDADPACVTDICEKAVRMVPGAVKAGENVLRVKHPKSKSSYFLGNFHMRSLPALTAEEAQRADLWMSLAQRTFDDRLVSPENLRESERHLKSIADLTMRRAGGDAVAAKAAALRKQVASELEVVTKSLWGDVTIAMKLNELDDADRALLQLERLYPEPGSDGNVLVRRKQNLIKELRKL